MRNITEIIIHCSATEPDWWAGRSTDDIRDEFRRWHKGRGWTDIGYHQVIGRDGTTAAGRPYAQIGAHVKNHNRNSIGICLVGGTPNGLATDKFSDHFTPEQDATLRRMITDICEEYPSITKITGHNEYANKGCPAFTVSDWLVDEPEPETSIIIKIINLIMRIFTR